MPRPLALVKAHAYGNDFLIVEEEAVASVSDRTGLARAVCDRHRGIGADGLMVVNQTPGGAAMRLWNADGSRSELSGNGVRCVGAWLAGLRDLGLGADLVIDSEAGPKPLHIVGCADRRWTFRAAMGHPTELRQERLRVSDADVDVVVLRVGNPQCVVLGPAAPERLRTLASALSVHPFFPEGTNVELAHVEAPDRVRILIWERGVGPTEASGTGACAAAVAAAAYGPAARDVTVVSPGGSQRVEWAKDGLWLTGWAEVVADVAWHGAEFETAPGS